MAREPLALTASINTTPSEIAQAMNAMQNQWRAKDPSAFAPAASGPSTANTLTASGIQWDVSGSPIAHRQSGINHPRQPLAKADSVLPQSAVAISGPVLGKRKAAADGLASRKQRALPTQPSVQIFQTDLQAYASIAATVKASVRCIQFHGTYSIIADPSITHRQRVQLVSDGLRQLAKLPHRYVFLTLSYPSAYLTYFSLK